MQAPSLAHVTIPALPQRLVAQPPSGGAQPPSGSPAQPKEEFQWSKALALPAYTYGAGAASLSALCGFAERFPAGGVTINPGGIIRNPEWTRNFGDGSLLHGVQPVLAAVGATVCLVRGALELRDGMKTGDAKAQLAGVLDLGLAAASALQIASPGVAGVAGIALIVARSMVEVHP